MKQRFSHKKLRKVTQNIFLFKEWVPKSIVTLAVDSGHFLLSDTLGTSVHTSCIFETRVLLQLFNFLFDLVTTRKLFIQGVPKKCIIF